MAEHVEYFTIFIVVRNSNGVFIDKRRYSKILIGRGNEPTIKPKLTERPNETVLL